MEKFTLSNGYEIPAIGYGTFRMPEGKETEDAVLEALKAGYRHIDGATIYGNEKSVGRALKRSGIPREDIFLISKLWNDDKGYEIQSVLSSRPWKISRPIIWISTSSTGPLPRQAGNTGKKRMQNPGAPWRNCTERGKSKLSVSAISRLIT